MIGITVFSHRLIILFALKHFWKHFPHGIFIETVSVTRDDALDKQYWISQSGESHDSVTHLVNKYVTCTHSAQIRQVSIWWNASGRWQWAYIAHTGVVWFARLADSILFIRRVITCNWNGSMKMPCGECFQKCFSAYNIISLWLNTVIPIIVMIWLPKMTRYLHWRIIYRHLTLVIF